MKEQDWQKKLVVKLEARGAYVVKIVAASKKGVPDILACYRGFFLGIEVKTPTTRSNVSKLQEYNLRQIDKAGGLCGIAVEFSDIEPFLDKIDETLNNAV